MTEQDIRELLEDLGSKVSLIAEENRVCKNRDDAGQQLITLLDEYIDKEDWAKIYKSIERFTNFCKVNSSSNEFNLNFLYNSLSVFTDVNL